jgi:putative flippase GtrA
VNAPSEEQVDPSGGSTFRQAFRFLVAGGLNTAFTVAVYEVLLFWMHYAFAFTISSALGVAFTGIAYTRFVFVVPTTTRRFVANGIYYFVSWALGLGLLDALVRWVGIHERIAMVLAIALLAPFNFLVLRYLLRR